MDDTSGEGQAGHQCGIEELKEYVTSNFTSRGVAIQSSGKKCFKLTLPQEMLNVEEFVEGITARGGAVDIMLETDDIIDFSSFTKGIEILKNNYNITIVN